MVLLHIGSCIFSQCHRELLNSMWFSGKLKGYKKSILTIKKKQYKKKTSLCLNLKKATETKNCGVIKK